MRTETSRGKTPLPAERSTEDRDDTDYLKTEFLERLAHELRGPAGVTIGALDEITRALGPRAEEFGTLLQMARRGIFRILRTADRLDRSAYFEAPEASSAKGNATDLHKALEKAISETQRIEGKRTPVEFARVPGTCPVDVEEPWLVAAFAELVSNAVRFAKTRVTVEVTSNETGVAVRIVDDGPGFAGPIPRRFEPPASRRGLGLSLAIVRDVIEGHGGRLLFRRKEPNGGPSGTEVVVELPRAFARAGQA